ncbi:MAG TPA: hypothetical protein VFB15_11000 [Candidatus Binataceae bacterium]|nr:hypothetical protein [Candidatus Binataceae bacterium]
MKRAARAKPKRSPMLTGILAGAIVLVGFATLIVRLEVTQEGYRLSSLRAEELQLQERNRRLRLEVAQLSSHDRLRAIAVRDGLGPPPPGHLVIIP